MSNFPCLNCPDREIGCHGKCEKYLKEKAEHNRKKDILDRENLSRSYAIEQVGNYKDHMAKKPKLTYGRHKS